VTEVIGTSNGKVAGYRIRLTISFEYEGGD
jgi:hypothetical protein